MADAQALDHVTMAYPVLRRSLGEALRPEWQDLRLLALRMKRESTTDEHCWTMAEHRRLIRMARAAASGASG